MAGSKGVPGSVFHLILPHVRRTGLSWFLPLSVMSHARTILREQNHDVLQVRRSDPVEIRRAGRSDRSIQVEASCG